MDKHYKLLYNMCNNYQIAYERCGFEGYSESSRKAVLRAAENVYDQVLKLLTEEGFEFTLGK